ncbi:type IV toxin-antitoxin system AbiEi family antitoxin domain-containing protein [Candidatus Micrarchaeota archaeon]|nr:type IV toxin-antitoxin system AbiEi family antitoxin domain-containing protein [Candidatus Micrarchaeota archaeon]
MKYSLSMFKSKKYPVFSMRDVVRIGIPKTYAKLLIHNHIKKGDLYRIKKGWYTFHDDPMLVVFAFMPAYLGLETALSIYKIWDQETIPVIITTRKVRTGIRKIMGTNVLIRRISPKEFTDYSYINYYGFWIPVSTLEKTYKDFIHFKEKIDSNTLRKLKQKIKKDKLKLAQE